MMAKTVQTGDERTIAKMMAAGEAMADIAEKVNGRSGGSDRGKGD